MDDMMENTSSARLPMLAEFRYQLRRFMRFSEIESEQLGVATQQYQLMQVIGAASSEEAASISYIAERMVLRHNSTVELVDRAERAGLVKRRSDERDLRRSIVTLTPEGQETLDRLIRAHLAELDGETGAELLRSLCELREGRTGIVLAPTLMEAPVKGFV